MALPITDVTTTLIRNAISESTNAISILRLSTLNNYWGFKYPYVALIQWGLPASGAFGYQEGDYRGYDHTYSAYTLDEIQDVSTGNYFEEGRRYLIDTRKLRSYMANVSYYHTYQVYVSANVGQDGWTSLGNFNLYNDNDEFVDVDLTAVPNLNPNSTMYMKVTHSDTQAATEPKFDYSQGIWNPQDEYLTTWLTPISTPVSIINLNDYSAVAYYNSSLGTTTLEVYSRAIRSGGADDATSYVVQFYMDGNNEFGSDQITGTSGTTNVVGKDTPSPLMSIIKTLQNAQWPIGRDGYADLTLINGSGNNSTTVVTVNFTVLPSPPV
jgi:hypothetical protein